MPQYIKSSGELGRNISLARQQAKLTQDQLASKLQTKGIDLSRGTLAKIEAGIRHLSVDELKAIKDILGMTYGDFFDS